MAAKFCIFSWKQRRAKIIMTDTFNILQLFARVFYCFTFFFPCFAITNIILYELYLERQ